jgi:long-chain fatty acid transport protein
MQSTPFRRSALFAAIGSALLLVSGAASASSFALVETGASGLGNAYAGAAAVADDASTIWWNPAGMTRFDGVAVTAVLHAITPSAKFENGNSQPACLSATICRPLGGNGGDAGDTAFVPSLYALLPIGRFALGIGVSAPFGLKTEYDSDWIGRYQAIKSDVKTLNINPSIAFKVNDMVSIGAGVNYQKIDAELTNAVNMSAVTAAAAQAAAAAGAIPAAAIPALLGASLGVPDGLARVKGNDSAYGYNVGLMLNLAPTTRVGLSYRSSIKYDITGDINFELPATAGTLAALINGATQPGQRLQSGPVHASIKVPDSWSLSAAHDLSSQLQLLADVSWTGWSSIPKLEFVRSNGTVLPGAQYDWKDTWRYSLGANYKINDRLMLRGGVAFDQTPMDTAHRTPRLPDGDRTWLSIGGRYIFMPNLALDVGYTHIFIKDPQIDNRNDGLTAQNALLDGKYNSSVNIVSVGLSYNFK